MGDDTLFDTEPLILTFGEGRVSARTGRPLSKRTLAQRASERRRLATMHGKHGHGPDGQTCKSCAFLKRHAGAGSSWLKCRRYGVTRSEASDWRAKWPACGAFTESA